MQDADGERPATGGSVSAAMSEPIRIWALLGARRGDNNQVLALADALGLPYEVKQLRYNRLHYLQPRLLGCSLRSLTSDSRGLISGEPPHLTISIGHRSVPVVREIRRRSGGRTRSVHIGFPRLSPDYFDLVVPTPEYPVPDLPNVIRTPLTLCRDSAGQLGEADLGALNGVPRPRRLLVIGGSTLYWRLHLADVLSAISALLRSATAEGGSVLIVGSPRTPNPLLRAAGEMSRLAATPALMVPVEGPPSFRALLAAADQIFVTADSVAMVSEAVMTGKPVGLVRVRPTLACRIYTSLLSVLAVERRMFPRDMRFFWSALERLGYAGTLDRPLSGAPPDLAASVADRVRQLLAPSAPPATDDRDSDRSVVANRF